MTDFEVDFYIKAFFQSKELRTKCISNIDQQVNTIRTVFISLLVALLTVVFTNNINWLLLLSIMMTFLFWCVESRCKQNQRGYIYVSNQLEKELSQTIGIGGEEEIIRLAEKYAFDLKT
jgi:Ca2+/Na+ antiporter